MALPKWVTDPNLTPDERRSANVEYHIRRAALHTNRMASIIQLSEDCGFGRSHLHVCIKRGSISRKVAFAIERVVGDITVFDASQFG